MGAEEALRWGMITAWLAKAELMDNARELAQQLVNSAPLAIAALKEIYRTSSTGRRSVSLYSQRRVETLSVGSAFGGCH